VNYWIKKHNPYWHRLSNEAWHAANEIEESVTGFYLRINRNPNWKIYPSVVAACCTKYKNNKTYIDTTHKRYAGPIDKRLKQKLCELGRIGHKPTMNPIDGNTIGHCAEQHAANNLLKEQNNVQLGDIFFGAAFRPRTGECKEPCENCTYVFPTLK